jgi:hypothetical protein
MIYGNIGSNRNKLPVRWLFPKIERNCPPNYPNPVFFMSLIFFWFSRVDSSSDITVLITIDEMVLSLLCFHELIQLSFHRRFLVDRSEKLLKIF